ncbi:MAG TPA: substrate-binding domain-containing protein [Hyphomicrobiaceae bacterium]|nr:substrate-binding domain-containing protein [Hyphomicrobiaceae bacterium]
MQVSVLSGGAAQGLLEALAVEFKRQTGYAIAGSFGAVGAMREKLLAGAPADLLILTSAMIADLARQGHVDAAATKDIGIVRTALAVPVGDPVPKVDTPEALAHALGAAAHLFFPDPQRATAGIHFAKVLSELGISGPALADKAQIHANGTAAMRALAQAGGRGALGCTQATEILSTPGVRLIGPLPAPFELATVYTVGLSAGAPAPGPARVLAALLAAPGSESVRARLGFEPV